MSLKYRIIHYTFPFAKETYVAQYKILGMWLNIEKNLKGAFFTTQSCYTENLNDAHDRILQHIVNMGRASDWTSKSSTIIWEI